MEKYLTLECSVCKNKFDRKLRQFTCQSKKSGENYKILCSKECKANLNRKRIKVCCETCGKELERRPSEISKNNFCNCSCAAFFSNKRRIRKQKEQKIKYCKVCGEPANSKSGTAKYCERCRLDKAKEAGKKLGSLWGKVGGSIGGKISASKQIRRSKNEIYFAQLCEKEYGNITTNDPCFKSETGNWDADIIIHEHKIAVLWNGVWHYRKVRKNHSLLQVQTRDKIKIKVIEENGYIAYVIADLGKFNSKFVEEEFEKFKEFLRLRKMVGVVK